MSYSLQNDCCCFPYSPDKSNNARFHFETLLIFFREGIAPSGERSSNSTSPLLEFAEKNNMNILEVQLLYVKTISITFQKLVYNIFSSGPLQPSLTTNGHVRQKSFFRILQTELKTTSAGFLPQAPPGRLGRHHPLHVHRLHLHQERLLPVQSIP